MVTWSEILAEVSDYIINLDKAGCPDPFFRGVSDSKFTLIPELARSNEWHETIEDRLYWRFTELGSHLMPPGITDWDRLFLMQHHELPTRLLDWTENFFVALYFALKGYKKKCEDGAAVWILNPYDLNKASYETEKEEKEAKVYNLNYDFPEGYLNYFVNSNQSENNKFPASILAIQGSSILARMQWQRSTFTLHRDLAPPLEEKFPDVVKKFTIPCKLIQEANSFLRLVGMNEFGAYPDLDGLARYIRESETR